MGHEAILSLVLLGGGVGIVPELVVQQSTLLDRSARALRESLTVSEAG